MKRIFIILSLAFISNVYAYQFTNDFTVGYYWGSFPISMLRYAVNDVEGDQLESLVRQAENAWENAASKEIWDLPGLYQLRNSNFQGNHVRWSNNFEQETGFDGSQTLAVTIRYQQGSNYSRTEIILNGTNPSLRNNIDNALYKTILHEMGHTIGIDHSSQEAIMAAYIGSTNTLTQDDVQAVNAAMDEHLYRQSIGYVIAQNGAEETEERSGLKALSCGTIDLSGGSGGNGPGNFFLSLLMGLMLIFASHMKPRLKVIPS